MKPSIFQSGLTVNKWRVLDWLHRNTAHGEWIDVAAVKAGKWDNKPEWEECLMRIVADIAKAVEADEKNKHADLPLFEEKFSNAVKIFNLEVCNECYILKTYYDRYIAGTVEDCLADAVIDILDAVEGFQPEQLSEDFREGHPSWCDREMTFPVFCLRLVGEVMYGEVLMQLEAIRRYCSAHGVDLRRCVQLKIKYNETR